MVRYEIRRDRDETFLVRPSWSRLYAWFMGSCAVQVVYYFIYYIESNTYNKYY